METLLNNFIIIQVTTKVSN